MNILYINTARQLTYRVTINMCIGKYKRFQYETRDRQYRHEKQQKYLQIIQFGDGN